MTPFGRTVVAELRSALVPIETASIVNYTYLSAAMRALLKNALFYVVPDRRIEMARDQAFDRAEALSQAICDVGVQPQGISLAVDQARAEAILAMEALIDSVSDAQPTQVARSLGIG